MISLILSPAHLDDGGAGLQELGASPASPSTALAALRASACFAVFAVPVLIAWRRWWS